MDTVRARLRLLFLTPITGRVGIALVAAVLIVARAVWPDLRFDETSLWIFVIAVLVWLIPDIGELINRIKKLKKGDLEIEFDKKVDELAEKIGDIEDEAESESSEEDEGEYDDLAAHIREALVDPAASPRGSLIALAVEIEDALRRLAEVHDMPEARKLTSPHRLMSRMIERQVLPQEVYVLFRDFWAIRNQAVHSARFRIGEEGLYRLIDIGVRILRLLNVRLPSSSSSSSEEETIEGP